jgi:hypothetical protein
VYIDRKEVTLITEGQSMLTVDFGATGSVWLAPATPDGTQYIRDGFNKVASPAEKEADTAARLKIAADVAAENGDLRNLPTTGSYIRLEDIVWSSIAEHGDKTSLFINLPYAAEGTNRGASAKFDTEKEAVQAFATLTGQKLAMPKTSPKSRPKPPVLRAM